MSQASVAHSSALGHIHQHRANYRQQDHHLYPPARLNDTSAAPAPPPHHLNGGFGQPPILPPPPHNNTAATIAMSSRHAPPQTSQPPHQDSPSRKRDRKPDWNEFYKNGPPKEIIYIHDTPTPEREVRDGKTSSSSMRTVTQSQGSTSRSTNPHGAKRIRTGLDNYAVNNGAYAPTTSSLKRSRTPVNNYLASNARVPKYSRNGTGAAAPDSPSASSLAGAKRRRTTRSTAAAVYANVQGGVAAAYHPPQKPVIKAKDVRVELVPDNQPQSEVDDEDGHYIVQAGADLTRRYKIQKLLGQGTFGKVVEAWDREAQKACAIKVIRSVQKYRDASRIELRVLQTLYNNDKHNRNKCIHLRHAFDFRNHICIVTDLLGMSVFDFLKNNNFAPFPNSHIQSFAKQLLISVTFLHDLNLIHTDLKPENILLVNSAYETFTYNKNPVPSSSTNVNRSLSKRRVLLDTEIRLIDFGSATFEDEYHSSVVSTRHYRAPEIIMGLGWSFPCDIWSIGCILVEFYTGDALFQTHDNLEHLAMMQEVVDQKIDQKLVRMLNQRTGTVAQTAQKMFKGLKLDYPQPDTAKSSKKYVSCMKKLHEIIPPKDNFHKQFLDLLKKIFIYDPSKRITAKKALEHPWFREQVNDDGVEAARIRIEREQLRARNGY